MRISDWSSDVCSSDLATGRRKDAVARVWVKPGTGKITINGRDQEVYFARPTLRLVINQPFGLTERIGQYDVIATVKGGGLSGQAGAVLHGIAQALTRFEPALRSPVKAAEIGRAPSELQSLMRISYAVFCLKNKKKLQ